jgi:hypothetical protein
MSSWAIINSMVVMGYMVASGLLGQAYSDTRMAPDGVYIGHSTVFGLPFPCLGVREEDGRLVPGQPFERTKFRVVEVWGSSIALALDVLWICLVVIALRRVWEAITKRKMSAGSVAILSTCIVLVLGMLACPHAPFPEDWQIDVSNR